MWLLFINKWESKNYFYKRIPVSSDRFLNLEKEVIDFIYTLIDLDRFGESEYARIMNDRWRRGLPTALPDS